MGKSNFFKDAIIFVYLIFGVFSSLGISYSICNILTLFFIQDRMWVFAIIVYFVIFIVSAVFLVIAYLIGNNTLQNKQKNQLIIWCMSTIVFLIINFYYNQSLYWWFECGRFWWECMTDESIRPR